jgi:hypothetical protein
VDNEFEDISVTHIDSSLAQANYSVTFTDPTPPPPPDSFLAQATLLKLTVIKLTQVIHITSKQVYCVA